MWILNFSPRSSARGRILNFSPRRRTARSRVRRRAAGPAVQRENHPRLILLFPVDVCDDSFPFLAAVTARIHPVMSVYRWFIDGRNGLARTRLGEIISALPGARANYQVCEPKRKKKRGSSSLMLISIMTWRLNERLECHGKYKTAGRTGRGTARIRIVRFNYVEMQRERETDRVRETRVCRSAESSRNQSRRNSRVAGFRNFSLGFP